MDDKKKNEEWAEFRKSEVNSELVQPQSLEDTAKSGWDGIPRVFEKGKYYKHKNGKKIFISSCDDEILNGVPQDVFYASTSKKSGMASLIDCPAPDVFHLEYEEITEEEFGIESEPRCDGSVTKKDGKIIREHTIKTRIGDREVEKTERTIEVAKRGWGIEEFEIGHYYKAIQGREKFHVLEKPENELDTIVVITNIDDTYKIRMSKDFIGQYKEITKKEFYTVSEYGVSFDIGKYYEHRSGGCFFVLGRLTIGLGFSSGTHLVGETGDGKIFKLEGPNDFEPNYKEITKIEFEDTTRPTKEGPSKKELDFHREELWKIRERADCLEKITPNRHWKRVYNNLSASADHLDACIARSLDRND